jgi:Ca2+-binding RTX toxin-like protein
MAKLQQALQAIASDLAGFAAKDDFLSLIGSVFGGGGNQASLHAIHNQLRRQDLSQLAQVRVINAFQLGGARAAYASSTNTIVLSDRFVAEASVAELKAVLLEEIGHAIDARINSSDRPGDEGELFSLLVRGLTPSASERQRILAEDDWRTISVDGKPLRVEQSTPIIYETTTIYGNTTFNLGYSVSGLNAAWLSRKGINTRIHFFNGTSASVIANSVYGYYDTDNLVISDGSVAYAKNEGGKLGLYRTKAGTTTKITTINGYLENLQIDGNTIVWETSVDGTESSEIYRSNGTTVSRITTNTVTEDDVQLSGSRLAWAAFDGNDVEIYLNDGTSTRALTDNAVEDYSPVLSGNKVAWLQWNNGQENLFFFDGTRTRQVTTNQEIYNPVISGDNLIFQRLESSGKFSLQLYKSSTNTTTELSGDLGPANYNNIVPRVIEASGNFVAWLENNRVDPPLISPTSATLKLFNGSETIVVNDNLNPDSTGGVYYWSSESEKLQSTRMALRGGKLYYLAQPEGRESYEAGELFVYDPSTPSANSLQLTQEDKIRSLTNLAVSGNRILWSDDGSLKLTQPTTKPILTIAGPTKPVVEGFSTPQNATLTVSLSKASATAVSVKYETIFNYRDGSDTATPGNDYTSTSGVLTFAPGVTRQTINVEIVNDDWSEEDETFRVRLFEASNAVLAPGLTAATVPLSDTWQVSGANGAFLTLPAGVENLTLTGTTNINGKGNAGANRIRGNSGNNRLDGGGGLYDNLIGGLGDDTYVIDRTFDVAWQYITENPGEGIDTMDYTSSATFTQNISIDDNVENLILRGTGDHSIFGNSLNNLITGNSGNNFIGAGDGLDTVSYGPAPRAVTVNLLTGIANGWGNDSLTNVENITGSRFNDTLIGDGVSNILSGGGGADRLTGQGGADKFDYRDLTHSRVVTNLDAVTDFDAASGGDAFLVSTARAGVLTGGAITALTAAGVAAALTPSTFLPHFAATLQLGSGATTRWFVAINNGTAGFDSTADALIEVTGFTGTIGASQFVTS